MHAIQRLIFHHSASPRDTTVEDIRHWHVRERGWEDIGYHRVIDGSGMLHRCREIVHQGAHAYGANRGSIGICIVGDNTKPGEEWTPDQIAMARRVVGAAMTLWPGIEVLGHRDVTSGTECPGLDVRALLLGPERG